MFIIESLQENGFDKKVLIDRSSQTRVEIIPDCGAMLHAFVIQDNGRLLNVIESYKNKNEYDGELEIKGFRGLKLSPFPCRLSDGKYRFNGKEYFLPANLSNGAVIHGLLYNRSFDVIGQEATGESATLQLMYEYKGDKKGYPFAYNCKVEFTLRSGNDLSIVTTIENAGDSLLPIADGWHPYFTFGRSVDDLELSFCSQETLEFKNLIPTGKILPDHRFLQPARIGKQEIDNSFVLDFSKSQPMCVLRDPDIRWQLEIYPEKSYPYLQVYIPPHRLSIALENLSAPPDSFNNGIGLATLSPGEHIAFRTKYILRFY